jgi:toxin ParE1/3/4
VKLRYTPRAIRQFAALAEFIAMDDVAAAGRVGKRIRVLCERLPANPELGRPGIRAGTRDMTVPGLPYIIVYRAGAGKIVIMGIYHSRQLRPGQSGL